MNINKNNYEAFFLDYHEGNLSPQQVADLLLFLEQHPGLKEEFENFENITLQDIPVTFENKNELKKDISSVVSASPSADGDWDRILISAVEGLLTKEEKIFLDQQLSIDAKLQHEFLLYQKTKITADTAVVFENKESLKHKEKKVIPFYYYIAAAASLLLLMGLFFVFKNSQEQQFAEVRKSEVRSQKLEVRSKESEVKNLAIHSFADNKEEKNSARLSRPSTLVAKAKVTEDLPGTFNEQTTSPTINKNENQQLMAANNQQSVIENQESRTKNQESTTNNQQPTTTETSDFLSLREVVATKIKEKALDENVMDQQKKSGRSRKLSGWDLVQIVTKGVSKFTGRDVEVKPTYNEEGDVTAYSLAIGEFQLTKAR